MNDVLLTFQKLPSHLRVDRYSSEESLKTARKIKNETAFQSFIAKNQYGFFLFSERARYNVYLTPKNGFCNFEADSSGGDLMELDAITILKALAGAGAVFGFAANLEEYHHRNRYTRTLGPNHFEAWVGRDLRKYLPGIYWLTLFSKQHSQILPGLSGLPAAISEIEAEHYLVKTFETPGDWRNHVARLDEWLAERRLFFSKQRIKPELDASPNILALSQLAREWA